MENEIKQITTIISSLPDGMMLSIIPENVEDDQKTRLKKIAVYIGTIALLVFFFIPIILLPFHKLSLFFRSQILFPSVFY